jgi:hypothetical protein
VTGWIDRLTERVERATTLTRYLTAGVIAIIVIVVVTRLAMAS